MNRINVLLVEDDSMIQKVHTAMLSKLGCNVDIASNGMTAMKMASSDPSYKIIFVDIGLPDISGFEVINQLRAHHQKMNLDTTIIAVTAYCGKSETQACINAGVSDVLNKPVVLNTMREVIEKYS
jgi:CheY-like chemotaxis protein